MFIIEDELHCEWIGEYSTIEEVSAELRRLAKLAWNKEPNRAPCISWKGCGREYVIIEYDKIKDRQIQRIPAMSIDAQGVGWDPDFEK